MGGGNVLLPVLKTVVVYFQNLRCFHLVARFNKNLQRQLIDYMPFQDLKRAFYVFTLPPPRPPTFPFCLKSLCIRTLEHDRRIYFD